MKKVVLWITVLCLVISTIAVFSLTGCKTEAEETSDEIGQTEEVSAEEETEKVADEAEEVAEETEPVTIDVWIPGDILFTIMKELTNKYTADHTNVSFNINTFDHSAYGEALPSAIASGKEDMDLFWYYSVRLKSAVEEGLILDLSKYYSELGWNDKIIPGGENHRSLSIDLEAPPYFFPYDWSSVVLYYNQDVLDKVGVSLPSNATELIEAASKCKEAGYTGISHGAVGWWAIGGMLLMTFASEEEKAVMFESSLQSYEEKSANIDIWKENETLMKCFEWLEDAIEVGAYDDDRDLLSHTDSMMKFVSGEAAFYAMGMWETPQMMALNPDANLTSIPFPGLDNYTIDWQSVLGIPSYVAENSPEKIDVIIDFFDSILEPDYAIEFHKAGNYSSSSLLDRDAILEVETPVNAEIFNHVLENGSEKWPNLMTQALLQEIWRSYASISDGTSDVDGVLENIYQTALTDLELSKPAGN